jgi:hypothetical protein
MLFSGDAVENRDKLYRYLDAFGRRAGFPLQSLEVSQERMDALCCALASNPELRERMSPFKIAGIFSVEFCRHAPVRNRFPSEKLGGFEPNSVFAYFYSVDGMTNATIAPQGITRRIPHRVKVSAHFFEEFSRALAESHSRRDCHLVALIYESLIYQFNQIYYERSL